MTAIVALAGWSIGVEIAQPWFTELRARQITDLFGNVIGISLVGVVVVGQQFWKSTRSN
jgi:glycopeptide antibiotics resistance protein